MEMASSSNTSAIICACDPDPATNDVTDYGVKKAVENLPELHEKLVSICDNYLTWSNRRISGRLRLIAVNSASSRSPPSFVAVNAFRV